MDDEIKQQVNKSTFLSVLFSMFTGVDQKKEFAMLLYEMLIHDLVSIGIEGEILDIIKGKIEKILLNLNDLCRSLQWYIGRNTPDYEANIQFMADVQVVYNPTEVSGGLSYAQVSSAVDSMLIQPLRSMFQKGIKEEQTSKLDNKKLAKLAEDFSHKYSKEIVPDVCRLYHIYFLHQICILKGIDKDSDKNIDYKPVFTRIFSNIEILDAISCIISSIPVICRMQRVIRTEMLSKVVLDGINYELLDKTIENMLKSSKNLPSGILKVLVDKTTVVLNENIKNVKFFFDDINDVTSVLKNALFLSTFRVSQAEHLDDFIQLASAIKNKAILKRTLAVYSFPLILRALTSGESLAKASIDKLSKSKSLLKISVSKLHTGSIKPLTHEIFRKCSSALKRMELIESYKTYALYTLILLVVFDFILLVLVVSSPKF
ncbi:uncharacterized protein VICG_00559 [Vittaforma corneae ATCC 50505]|uniref:Uncharacterized protein n=1 Tax=Vittaforma corneae (strain ATCC 50505) TaxID=993615 RepID=L2GPM5_VITCO|nr:uncharacterized protein VICG_00559 [Vittaforma corneae ATCC 50505]ELA42460.1 hypothetical protein VICG_00559 [Vittaforma corneae ATCC 50505]